MSASPASRLRLALCAALLPALFAAPAAAHDAPGEYFFGDDPGVGAAMPLPLAVPAPALADIHDFALPLPASPGKGVVLGLRFRDADGQWGTTAIRRVYLLETSAPVLAEWAWGGGFAPTPSEASPATDGALTLARPSPAPAGALGNRLALRARSDGLVGHAAFATVSPFGGSAPARLYHAIDHSPDPETAAFVPLSAEHATAPVAVPLVLGDLAPGFHSLHLQLHDANGARAETVRFIHVTPSRVQTLSGLAYTFRKTGTDSGDASTAISVAPLVVSASAQDVTIPVPPTLSPGDYTLVLQLADAGGDLLAAAPLAPLEIGSAALAAYETWAEGLGLTDEEAAPLADPDADGLVNLLEYAFGGSPRVADSPSLYTVTPSLDPSGHTMITVAYRQREGGVGTPGIDYTADGLRYTVEASTDLQTWRPYPEIAGIAAHVDRDPTGSGIEFINIELFPDSALGEAGRVFARLNISLTP